MKKKSKQKKVIYINEFEPVIECGDRDNWSAHYYYDLSGELFIDNPITDKYGDRGFFRDDGGLKGQIEYLQEYMDEIERAYKEDLKTCKNVLKVLKKELATFKTKKYIVKIDDK